MLRGPRDFLRNPASYMDVFRGFDAVIISGGTPIYDYDHLSRVIHFLIPKNLKLPKYCFGIGVKSLSSYQGRLLLMHLLRSVNRISTRDRCSQRLLTSLHLDGIQLTGDSALFLEPDKSTEIKQNLKAYMDNDAPKVAIFPRVLSDKYRAHYHDRQSKEGIKDIYCKLAYVADVLISMGYQIIFIPLHRWVGDSDFPAISKIIQQMDQNGSKVIKSELRPGEVLRLIREMDLVVGLRLHSLIFAAMTGVPFLTINYDRKIEGLVDLLGLGNIYPPFLNGFDIEEQIGYILDNRSLIQDSLILSTRKAKKRIYREAIEVMESFTSQRRRDPQS